MNDDVSKRFTPRIFAVLSHLPPSSETETLDILRPDLRQWARKARLRPPRSRPLIRSFPP